MKKPKLPSLQSLVPQPKVRKPMTKLEAAAHRLTPSAYDDYEEEPTTKLSTAFVVVLMLHLVAVGGVYAFHSIKAKRREADGTTAAAKASPAPIVAASIPAVQPPVPAPMVAPVAPAPAPVAVAVPTVTAPARVAAAPASPERITAHQAAPSGPSAVIAQPRPQAPTPVSASPAPVTTVAAKAQPASVMPVKAVAAVPAAQAVNISPAASPSGTDTAPKTYTVLKGDNPVAIAKRFGVNYEEMLKLNGVEDPRKLQIGQTLKLPAKKHTN